MKIKKIAFVILAVLLIMQIIRIDTTVQQTNSDSDFLIFTNAPNEISAVIRSSCYDCHSNETKYPWYSKIAPVSWYLKHHINEGREHLNFSQWKAYSAEEQLALRKECIDEVKNKKMPLRSYTLMHVNSKLTADSEELLLEWLNISK